MAINQTGNRATTQYHAWVPDMPGFTGWQDKDFADMRTPEEQIWWLYAHITSLTNQTENDNLAERVSALEKQISDLLDSSPRCSGAWVTLRPRWTPWPRTASSMT